MALSPYFTVLFAVRQLYGMPPWLEEVASLILPTWSIYVFLMAIGISADLLSEKRCKMFREVAKIFLLVVLFTLLQ